jgi:UDPglucose 6-dehydrogenase
MNAIDAGPIGFAGLSHLGIVYSLATAAQGFEVVGFDPRPGLPEDLNVGRFPVREPGLEELFAAHRSQVRYTADLEHLAACPVIFFALDIHTDEDNQSDVSQLRQLIEEVCRRVAAGATLVIMSQVPPGFSRRIEGQLAQNSARVQLFYQVETLIFGNAVERARKPERYIIGCLDPKAGFPKPYDRFLHAFGCPLLPMRYESAELCKIAINCFLVSSVSTTNMLAEICENTGADWREIVPALRLDRRIGPGAYLSPGLGIAGGNLERDLVTVNRLSAECGSDARLVAAWQQNSLYRKDWALRLLHRKGLLNRGSADVLAIWGVTYKSDTHSTKNSPALALMRALRGYRLLSYDPAAKPNLEEFPHVQVADSALEAVRNASALVIMTPWKEFSQAPLAKVKELMRGNHLLDPHGVLDGDSCRMLGFDYLRLGA